MKLPGIVRKLISVRKVMGVEVNVSDKGVLVHYCVLELKNNAVNLLKSATDMPFDHFLKQVDTAVPLSMTFDGKGIIHKSISLNETDDTATILNKTLPNTSTDDFYVTHTELFNSHCIATASRKAGIEELLSQLRQSKADLIHMAFGPFQVKALLPLITAGYNAEVNLPACTLQFTDGYVSGILPRPNDKTSFTIGTEAIDSKLLVSFAAAFSVLTGTLPGTLSNLPLQALKDDFSQKKIFKTGLVAASCFLFAVLLINFFLFTHYSDARQRLEERVNVNKSSISQIDTLKKELAEREMIVKRTGLLQSSRASYYADRIASSVPFNVRLTQLAVFPQEKNKAEEDNTNYKFRNSQIEVQGRCKYSIDVNDWINEMRAFAWAKNIRLVHYNPSSTEKGSDFIIQIDL